MTDQLVCKWLDFTATYNNVSKQLEQDLMSRHHLALKEFYVLMYLDCAEDNQLPLKELQNKVGLSQSAMSRLATRMESKDCGVIRRQGYGDDKRGVYAKMTDKGHRFYDEVKVTFEETLRATFQ
ncbi:MarR family transcriptional regulator [Staphylococcus pragensis]|uniref:MarR family transcriptional regulator n=1 Tax=Staphylococcus pragensis TaxID=1611836 RepID=A0A4Z1ATZ9_9STAP|nr:MULTISPECIES: MarR family transcriptional regulator [Staphylococcus]RTX92268.1 MarR family transcriptional regulator [Staphylococcus carnosus]TGN22613.1 MarR family transcriptional regulator [Staphylococcus pragensis]GGG98528.1 transcriptional regulator [Staphylococcus pragensis]